MQNLALESATLICLKIGMQELLMHTIASLMIRFGVYGLPRGLGDQIYIALNKLGYPGPAPLAKIEINFGSNLSCEKQCIQAY